MYQSVCLVQVINQLFDSYQRAQLSQSAWYRLQHPEPWSWSYYMLGQLSSALMWQQRPTRSVVSVHCCQWIVGFAGTFIPACSAIWWSSLWLGQIIAHDARGGTPTHSLRSLCFFAGSTSHLLHTTQKSVMITEDFGTHLAAGRWRSKVLRL